MTILSTDLRALRRRGYNGKYLSWLNVPHLTISTSLVDRILNQQKVERTRAEAARVQLERERKEAQEADRRSMADTSGQHNGNPPAYPSEKGATTGGPTPAVPPIALDAQHQHQHQHQSKANSRQSVLGTLNTFRERFSKTISDRGNEQEGRSLLGLPESGSSTGHHTPRPPTPSGQITSQDSIGR